MVATVKFNKFLTNPVVPNYCELLKSHSQATIAAWISNIRNIRVFKAEFNWINLK